MYVWQQAGAGGGGWVVSDSAYHVEQYEKKVMELHKAELLTAEGTKGHELKCDCSGFWEHTVCSHIWAVLRKWGDRWPMLLLTSLAQCV
jgi:hypothetical protein